MSEGGKRNSYKDHAKRAYAYYKKYGIFGAVQNFWHWLLLKPERLTALSTFAIFLATAVGLGVAIDTFGVLRGQLTVLKGQLDAMKRDQAPYIYIVPNNSGFPEFKTEPNGETRIVWTSDFTNSGKGLAVNVIVNHFMKVGADKFRLTGGATGPVFAGDMPIGVVHHGYTASDHIERAEYDRLLGVQNGIALLLEFRYKDTAGDTYESDVCLGQDSIARIPGLRNPEDCKKERE